MNAARKPAKWLKGNGGIEFLQFANAHMARTPSPLGGYHYRVTRHSSDAKALYSGNDYIEAFKAATASTTNAGVVG